MNEIYKTIRELGFYILLPSILLMFIAFEFFINNKIALFAIPTIILGIIFVVFNKFVGNLLQKIKKNPKESSIIISILILLTFLFYWYEIRPSNILKECEESEVGRRGDYATDYSQTKLLNEESCWHSYGLR